MRVKNSIKLFAWGGIVFSISATLVGFAGATVFAQTQSGFSIQVSPSPLVGEVKPGQTSNLELKVRNTSTELEELKIEPRKFTVDNKTGKVTLDDSELPEISPWITFSPQIFTVKPGAWTTINVRVSLPKESGFSYSLALVINRTKDPKSVEAGRAIKGSVAVFTLINVDRPGAIRKLEVEKFATSQNAYEYLPATISMTFKNTGNTIVQPYGNVFIQRGSDDKTPLATLPVNDKKGYILPGSNRILDAEWADGFPSYKITTAADGNEQKTETWNWSQVSKFRIGSYTAKLVAVYNDGQRDVPIEKQATFWVIPWKILLGVIVVIAILALGVWSVLRKIWSLIRRSKTKVPKQ